MVGKGKVKANPILAEFTSYELKAELCRRRKEGGLFRWILWRMGEWKGRLAYLIFFSEGK